MSSAKWRPFCVALDVLSFVAWTVLQRGWIFTLAVELGDRMNNNAVTVGFRDYMITVKSLI